MGRKPNPERKPALLEQIIAELTIRGIGDLSLRPLATALGVSTYSLTYHFGTREQLITEVIEHIDAEHHRLTAEWYHENAKTTPGEGILAYWAWQEEPEHLEGLRLLVEVIALPSATHLVPPTTRARLVTVWNDLLAEELVEHGVEPAAAQVKSTLVNAALNGLVLDLVATGEHDRVRAAVELLAQELDSWAGTAF
ncbi:TetR/AcrR family transcriptional regulator [Streptomyces europaeiscabiei]|uniref:TetR/AcrR family transcriptional regulator n=1 Tax=Streptomyces europaeiscabiei TaxID=146819 RepID=UPI002E14C755|nr:TetR/AcrR family transcriptional regulator [Streptomyces europaeiscabiei]